MLVKAAGKEERLMTNQMYKFQSWLLGPLSEATGPYSRNMNFGESAQSTATRRETGGAWPQYSLKDIA